jgi:hypothetical protein
MLRVELFVLIGFALGVPVGALLLRLTQKFLAARDQRVEARVVKARVEVALDQAETGQLIDELSQRDDIGSSSTERKKKT